MAVDNSKILNIPGVSQDGDQHRQMVMDSMITKEPSTIKDARDNFTNLQTSAENLTDKISSISSKISNDGKAVSFSVTDLASKVDQLKTAINDLRQAAATPFDEQQLSANFNVFATKIRALHQEMIDASGIAEAIDDYVKTVQTSSDVTQLVGELQESLNNVNGASGKLVEFIDKFEQLSKSLDTVKANATDATSSLNSAATQANEFGQRVGNVGASVNAAKADADVAVDAAKNVKAQADDTTSYIRMMVTELDKSAKSVRDVESLSRKFFNDFASDVNLGVINQLASTVDDVRAAKMSSDSGNFDTTQQRLSSATRNVIESLLTMSNEVKRKQASANDQFELLHSAKAFGDNQLQAMQNYMMILEAHAQSSDSSTAALTVTNLRSQITELTERINASVLSISDNLSAAINSDVSINVEMSAMHYNKVGGNLGASGAGLASARNAIDFPQAQRSAWYQRFAGNFVTNREGFGDDLVGAQRTNMASQLELPEILNNLNKFKASGDDKGVAIVLKRLVTLVTQNAEAHAKAGAKLDLYKGQYGGLNNDDKSVVNGFSKSTASTISNLRETIRAVEEVDPASSSLKELNSLNRELTGMNESIEASKAKSTTFGDTVKNALSGITKARNIIGGGLGVMGLGALSPSMGNLRKFGTGAFDAYAEDGGRRYDLALTDASMGADVNPARAGYLTNDMADYYYKLSGGRIGFGETTAAYSNLARNVGGHYGESNEAAANDMMTITKDTFGMQKLYGLSDSTVAGTMKTFYKDLRMSADDASGVLASLCQTAQSANIPIGKYADLVVRMADNLRSVGVDGRQTKAIMGALVRRGMRPEDASDLLDGMTKAQTNMSSNWNESAFYGMMSGQGGDPFENVRSGVMAFDANGDVDKNYYGMMAQRVISRNNLMSSMGGGPNSALGGAMMFDDFVKQGFSRKSASSLTDAAMMGDQSLLASLMEDADAEKDGGKEALNKAMTEANERIAKSSDQLAETTKIQAELALAQKKLGEKIRSDLTEPLAKFRQGFEGALKTIVTTLGQFMDKLNKLLSSDTGKSALESAGNHPFMMAGAGVVGTMIAGGALAAGKRAMARGAESVINRMASRIFGGTKADPTALASNASKFEALKKSGFVVADRSGATRTVAEMEAGQRAATGSRLGKFGKVAGAAALLYGGYEAYKHFSSPSGDPTSETNRLFKTGEAKISITNDPSAYATPEPDAAAYGGPGDHNGGYAVDRTTGASDKPSGPTQSHVDEAGSPLTKALGIAIGSGVDAYQLRGTIAAGKAAMSGGSMFSKILGVGKRFVRGSAIGATVLGLGNAYSEYADAQEHPDAEPMWKRAMRVGIDTGLPLLGGALGTIAGAFVGGAGAVPGAMIGGVAGSYLADFIKDKAGLTSDKSNGSVDKMRDASDEQVQRYTDSADSLVNSNSERGKATERELKRHGQTLSDLNQDQQRYMDDLFTQLRAAGYGELAAAQGAANAVATQNERKYTEGDKVYKATLDDTDSLNTAMYKQQAIEMNSGKPKNVKGINNAIHWQEGGDDMNPADHGNDDRDTLVKSDVSTIMDLAAKNGARSTQVTDWVRSNFRTSDGSEISAGRLETLTGQLHKAQMTGNTDPLYESMNSYENENYTYWAQQSAMTSAQEAAANSNNEKPTVSDATKANTTATPRGGHSVFDNMSQHQVTSGFGMRMMNGKEEFHPGVDYAANLGDKMYAMTDGKVSFTKTEDSGGYGNMITITRKDGSKVILGHADGFNNDLKDGQEVTAGTVVGFAGTTGRSTGVHTHVEYRDAAGNPIDPSEYAEHGISPDGSLGDGSSPSSSTTGSSPSKRATTPEEAVRNSRNLAGNYAKQIADLHGMSTSDIMNDRVATGKIVFGGASTAFMDRGVYMNTRGVRDDFYKMSGIKDFDRAGYGVRGYFDGNGKGSDRGSMQIRAENDKKYGANDSSISFVEGAEQALHDSTDAMFATASSNKRNNEDSYQQAKMAEERRAAEGGYDAKNRTNCQVTVIETGGGGEVKRTEFVSEMNRVNEQFAHFSTYLNNIASYH